MTDFTVVKDVLQLGGNSAMILLLVVFWKFDRRLIKIELIMEQMMREQNVIKKDLKGCVPAAVPREN